MTWLNSLFKNFKAWLNVFGIGAKPSHFIGIDKIPSFDFPEILFIDNMK